MASAITQVYYFVPEDAESGKQMNCFIVRRPANSITLRQLREDFPLPGEYQFRFEYHYQSSSCKVWLDLPSEESLVPLTEGEIRVKATRLSWSNDAQLAGPRVELPKQEVR